MISLDPVAIAALLELTGPVSVAEWPEPLSHLNAADVLLRQQYLALGEGREFFNPERIDFLDSLVEALFERLQTIELPAPPRIGEVLPARPHLTIAIRWTRGAGTSGLASHPRRPVPARPVVVDCGRA